MNEGKAGWETYEEVAVHLLDRLAGHLDLEYVEEKQKVEGESGARWEIDGKGVGDDGEGFVILECKRYPDSRVPQGKLAKLAYRISDTGAAGGIVVTPIGLQEGAKQVAEDTGVRTVELDESSTTADYMMRFLDTVFVGLSETGHASDEVSAEIIEAENDDEGIEQPPIEPFGR